MKDGIELQFLSGEHLGAVVELHTGSYTIGNTEDCDLWLACGGEPCVAQITLSEDGKITVKSVAGKPLYAGTPLGTEDVEFASSKILNLNLNCIAWFKDGEKPESLEAADLGFKVTPAQLPQSELNANNQAEQAKNTEQAEGQIAQGSQTGEQQDTQTDKSDVAENASQSAKGTSNEAEQNSKDSAQDQEKGSGQKSDMQGADKAGGASDAGGAGAGSAQVVQVEQQPRDWQSLYLKLFCGLCFLGFLLCLLILGNTWFSRQDPELIALQNAQAYIKSHNYSGVVVEVKDGLLLYTGSIPDRKEYALFIQNLPQSELSSVIDVQIADSVLRAIERAFALQGLQVRVAFGNRANELIAYGYVQDSYLAKLAMDKVQPYLGKFNLVPHFTYAPDMQELLFKLNADGTVPLKFSCGRSSILYQGQMDLEQAQDFEKLRKKLELAVNAPVVLENTQRLPETSIVALSQNEANVLSQSGMNKKATESSASKIEQSAVPADKPVMPNSEIFDASEVVGVTLDPMRFLTLRNGSKYFEGTVLKNGYVLQHISLEQLVFEKNGHQVIVYLQ